MPDLKSVYIAAVGGQGGNLLAEWLTLAATLEGQRAQSVSLTGLSQRGGATGYYVELASGESQDEVVFCQYPVPGELDVLVGTELLELARAVEQGLTSEKTTVLTSTSRLLSTPEKLPAGGGVMDSAQLLALARQFSGRTIAFDAAGLAQRHGMDDIMANAILFGALAASDVVGISCGACEQAIRQAGIAVERNVAAFNLGYELAREGRLDEPEPRHEPTLEQTVETNANRLDNRKARQYRQLMAAVADDWVYPLREIFAEALYRLIDYQNMGYARRYLRLVENMWRKEQVPQDPALTLTYARSLATMMMYEDAARVAQLKIRQDRFERIKTERGLLRDQLYVLRDYLKPDAYEVYGLFPVWLVALFLPICRKLFPGEHYLELRPKTNSILGVFTFWFLTLFAPLRPWSYRARDEWRLINSYTENVLRFLATHYELGVLMAETGQMTKGYGHTRRKTREAARRYVENILQPLITADVEPYRLTVETARALQRVIAADDPGIDEAEERGREVVARARCQPPQDVLAYVAQQPKSELVNIQPATRPATH